MPTAESTLLASSSNAADASTRPKIALVLSGGGARGFAHVGVLRELQRLQIPIDFVVGTSMGAVVGGAFAAGRSPDELAAFFAATDWDALLSDSAPRSESSMRRKDEDFQIPSNLQFNISRNGIRVPPSAANARQLERALSKLLGARPGEEAEVRSKVPFAAVATDLLNGDMVVLDGGSLFDAVRASLSIPGLFPPTRVNGRLLVDGGLVRNLPVDIARNMGADIIIAVNVGTPLSTEEELQTAFGVANQMLHILTEQNVKRSMRQLTDKDILISPALDGTSFLDFSDPTKVIGIGERAAQRLAERLARFSSPGETLLATSAPQKPAAASSLAAPMGAPATPERVDRVEVEGTRFAPPSVVAAISGIKPGEPVSRSKMDDAVRRLYGTGDFDRVDVAYREKSGQRVVSITAVESEWATSRLRLGLELSSDFAEENTFTLTGMYVRSWMNSWGAEWRTIARAGTERELLTEFWQPLSPGGSWFVGPRLGYRVESSDIFEQGKRVGRYRLSARTGEFSIGKLLSNWGSVSVGMRRQSGEFRLLLPAKVLEEPIQVRERAKIARLEIDTLDSLSFPTKGYGLFGTWEKSSPEADVTLSSSQVVGLSAFRYGNWAGHYYGEWSSARRGVAPLSLGGFFRLSGSPRESISGESIAFGRFIVARSMGRLPVGLGGVVRLGFSAEAGAAYARAESLKRANMRYAGSVFTSVDTRFGPLYLGTGKTKDGETSVYLFLGRIW
ncbi:MAG: patatin-like phospholipase family protein [Burkholderiales bacterium]